VPIKHDAIEAQCGPKTQIICAMFGTRSRSTSRLRVPPDRIAPCRIRKVRRPSICSIRGAKTWKTNLHVSTATYAVRREPKARASKMTRVVGYLLPRRVQPVTGANRREMKMEVMGAAMKTNTGAVIADRLHTGTDATVANVSAAAIRSARKISGRRKGM